MFIASVHAYTVTRNPLDKPIYVVLFTDVNSPFFGQHIKEKKVK